jgi:hypothetical protein
MAVTYMIGERGADLILAKAAPVQPFAFHKETTAAWDHVFRASIGLMTVLGLANIIFFVLALASLRSMRAAIHIQRASSGPTNRKLIVKQWQGAAQAVTSTLSVVHLLESLVAQNSHHADPQDGDAIETSFTGPAGSKAEREHAARVSLRFFNNAITGMGALRSLRSHSTQPHERFNSEPSSDSTSSHFQISQAGWPLYEMSQISQAGKSLGLAHQSDFTITRTRSIAVPRSSTSRCSRSRHRPGQ